MRVSRSALSTLPSSLASPEPHRLATPRATRTCVATTSATETRASQLASAGNGRDMTVTVGLPVGVRVSVVVVEVLVGLLVASGVMLEVGSFVAV